MSRVIIALVFVCALVGSAHAEPRHVRILWNVAVPEHSCVRATMFTQDVGWPPAVTGTEPGPSAQTDGVTCPTDWKPIAGTVVQAGDYVSALAFNYNPISFKTLAPVVTTLQPETPTAVTILGALLGRVAGVPFSGAGSVVSSLSVQSGSPIPEFFKGSKCAGTEKDPDQCLDELERKVVELRDQVDTWERDLRKNAELLAQRRVDVPARLRHKPVATWNEVVAVVERPTDESDNRDLDLHKLSCEFSKVGGKDAFGKTCEGSDAFVQRVSEALGGVFARIRAFDVIYAPDATQDMVTRRDRTKRAVDGMLEYLTASQTDVRSEVAAGVKQLADDLAVLASYKRALDNPRAYAVELPRQGPVKSLSTLVFALPLRFVGDPDTAPAQETRTLTVPVAASLPPVLISAGVMAMPQGAFDFGTLAIQQEPAEGGAVTKRLVAVETNEFRTVTALVATHVQVGRVFKYAWMQRIYGTLGTTADNKIFRNVLVGGSWYQPEWRSVFTVGMMMAKGASIEEIDAVIARYTVDGVPSSDLNVAQVPLPDSRHWRFVLSWTFAPF
jgi:hypothetical protein